MTVTSPPPSDGMPFRRTDLDRLVAAQREIKDFEQFVLLRFLRFTQMGLAKTNRSGKVVEPQEALRDKSGWAHWRLRSSALFPQDDMVTVERYLADDRGPGMITDVVDMPLSFVFNETGADERYQSYLDMKKEFEGGAEGVA